MSRKLIIVAIIVAVMAATIAVVAAPRGGNRPGPPPAVNDQRPCCGLAWGLGPRIVAELQLTQDQIKQLQQLRTECAQQTETAREQLRAKVKEMAGLWTAENPDAAAIKALLADIDVLRAEIRDVCVDKMIAGLGVLTPGQRAKLRELVKNRPWGGMGLGCCLGMGPGGCGMGMGPGMRGMGMGSGPGPGAGPGPGTGVCPFGGPRPGCPMRP